MRRLVVLLWLSALAVLPAGGCYRGRLEAVQLDAQAYLLFTGNAEGGTAALAAEGRTVWTSQPIEPGTRYTVKPGPYELTVRKGGKVAVHRKIFVGDGQVFEVRVP